MANPIMEAMNSTKKYTDVVNLLFNARTNAHIAHLQTRAYPQHMALDSFYSSIVPIADRFAEVSMGYLGTTLTGFDLGKLNTGDILQFLKSQKQELLSLRSQFKEGDLVQLIDDACEVFNSTIYKLTILK